MQHDRAAEGVVAAIPAVPVYFCGGRRRRIQLHQGEIGRLIGRQQLRAAGLRDRLISGHRCAAVGTADAAADRAFVFPVHDQAGCVALRRNAVIGRAQVRHMIVAHVVEQLAGTKAAVEHDHGFRVDLAAPGIALRADRIDIATAAADARIGKRLGSEDIAVAHVHGAKIDLQKRFHRLRQQHFDQGIVAVQQRRPELAGARIVAVAIRPELSIRVADKQLRARRQEEVAEAEIQRQRAGRVHRQPPQRHAIGQVAPLAGQRLALGKCRIVDFAT